MVNVEEAITVRIKKDNEDFEILVNDIEKALLFKKGKEQLEDILITDEVFIDVKKGLHASEDSLNKAFNTTDKKQICERIIKEGEIVLTAEYKNKLIEEKRKQIIHLIHRNAIDPKTNLPHPEQRILNAIEEAKIKIDYHKTAEQQINDIVNSLRTILPIKYELAKLEIIIPAQYSGQSFNILKQFSKILSENWKNDGNLVVNIEIPAGLQNELFNNLNNLTHGSIESRDLNK